MSDISIGNLRAIAWHLEQGHDNGGISRDALALQLRSVADQLEAAEHQMQKQNTIYICPFCNKEVIGGNWDIVFADFDPKRAHAECNRLSLMPSVPNIASTRDELSIARCHAQSDGDCNWRDCPQLRDGEPHKTGRHCPLDVRSDEC